MRALGLKSRVRLKKYCSYRGQEITVRNLLARPFLAERPNQKEVTDVAKFNVRGEKLYLSPNGTIVPYEMYKRLHFSLVGCMLKMVWGKHPSADAPLLHFEQGWQCQMTSYRRHRAERGLTQSISRKGKCRDGEFLR